MATAAVLTERAESLGLPITKNAFEGTLENPVPPLPYMVYLLPREATAGADSRPNNLMADDWQLELYTVADDETAEEIRTRIENEVLHDVDYVKFVAYVDSEECFQTAYEVTGLLRKTIVGNNQAGFTIAFAKDSETVIDAEFKAQPMDKEGTLILYTEDIDKTE